MARFCARVIAHGRQASARPRRPKRIPRLPATVQTATTDQWMVPGQAGVLGESAVKAVEEVGGGGTAAALLLSTGVDLVLGRLSRLLSAGMVAAMVGITS